MVNRLSVRFQNAALLLTGILVSGALFGAGASAQTSPSAEPTRTPEPTRKAEPTRTPEPTRKPEPTKAPEPTRTPEPTRKPEPTRTPEPTRKPEPTKAPEPTRTPEPTRKPEPTRTPEPTRKPEPTRTPEATRTPEPTRKPEPTRTPAPTPRPTTAPTPAPGSIAFAEPNFPVREDAGTALVSVRRVVQNGVGASGAVSVKYQTTTGGTATAGSDYTGVTGTLSWASGDGSVKTFRVPIVNDTVREANETVFLRLYDLTGDGTIAPSRQTATLTILDDETGSIDTIAPNVTIVTPAANSHIANFNAIRGTAQDEGGSRLARVGLLIRRLSDRKFWSGTEWVAREVTLETELSGNVWTRLRGNPAPPNLTDDFYQITAVAYDGAGNVGRASVEVSVDATAPSLTIVSPAKGARLRALTRAVGTVADEGGEVKVFVYLRRATDGKFWNGHEWAARAIPLAVQLRDSGEWVRTEWPVLDAGNYALTAIAFDSVNNRTLVTNEFSILAQTTTSAGSS